MAWVFRTSSCPQKVVLQEGQPCHTITPSPGGLALRHPAHQLIPSPGGVIELAQ